MATRAGFYVEQSAAQRTHCPLSPAHHGSLPFGLPRTIAGVEISNRGQIKFSRTSPTSTKITLIISYELPDVLVPFANVSVWTCGRVGMWARASSAPGEGKCLSEPLPNALLPRPPLRRP